MLLAVEAGKSATVIVAALTSTETTVVPEVKGPVAANVWPGLTYSILRYPATSITLVIVLEAVL
jgi:hypothetical protein